MSTALVTSIGSLEFATKLKKIEFTSSDNSVSFRLHVNNDSAPILAETYYPDNSGKVIIYDIDQLLLPYLTGQLYANVTLVANDVTVSTVKVLYCTADVKKSTSDFCNQFFLTHLQSKVTHQGWREYLYLYHQTGSVTVSCSARYSDGTTKNFTVQTISTAGTLATLDVKPANYNVSGKVLIQYTVTAGARTITFNVDTHNVECAPKLIFRNSFGCEETLYCTGTHELAPEYKPTSAYVEGEYKNVDIEENKVFKAYTGILTADMSNWADDLFRSTAIYLFSIANDNTLARGREIAISNAKAERNNEADYLPNYYFEYRYAQRNHNVFDDVVPGRIFDNTFDNMFY